MIKNVFYLFHSLTLLSSLFATVIFLIYFVRSQESLNLFVLIPALIVSSVLILNSYFMYQGQFETGYFRAMQVITIIIGFFSVFALIAFGQAFGGSTSDVFNELIRAPLLVFKDPGAALFFSFPLLAAGTAIISFYLKRPQRPDETST